MTKGTVLRVRISDDLYQKIKIISRGQKSVSDYVRDAIRKDLKETGDEAIKFADLISRIESTDITQIAAKVELTLSKLERLRMLDDILYFARRSDIAIEEFAVRRLARSDFIKDFLEKIKTEMEKEVRRQ